MPTHTVFVSNNQSPDGSSLSRSLSRNVYKMVLLRFSAPLLIVSTLISASECLFEKSAHAHIPQGLLGCF